tara:strand:+ start:94 stop:495 length:402 start_codon:yes stop_codon:yes gene_type:complete
MTLSSTDRKEIRKFGVIAFLFFGLLCTIAAWRQKILIACLFGSLSLLGMGFLIGPGTLKPIYDKWLQIAHFIGKTITVIMLTLAYYLVITPSALIKKIFGGSPIPLKRDKKVSSYWVSRSELAQPKERFLKRF